MDILNLGLKMILVTYLPPYPVGKKLHFAKSLESLLREFSRLCFIFVSTIIKLHAFNCVNLLHFKTYLQAINKRVLIV